MQQKSWNLIDKSSWPNGAWKKEPDKVQWMSLTSRTLCLAVRQGMGYWCGYAAIERKHPLHSIGYMQCSTNSCRSIKCRHSPGALLSIHGGVTYAGPEDPYAKLSFSKDRGDPKNLWLFGFDCAHAGDKVPTLYIAGTTRIRATLEG